MNPRIIFILLFCLSACKAQQPVIVKSEPGTETAGVRVEEKKQEPRVIVKSNESKTFFLLFPVDLSAAIVQDSILADSFYVNENIGKEIRSAVDFYQGALLAVDSLRKSGANLRMKVIDIAGSDEQQLSAIWKLNFDKCNAVFSMLRGKPLNTLSGILLAKNIPLVSCAPNSLAQLEKNKNAFCVQPSSLTQCRMMGEYAGENFRNDNLIIVSSSLEKEQERSHAFVKGVEKINPSMKIKKVNLTLEGRKGLNKLLEAGKSNTLFVPSADEDFVTTFYSALDSSLGIYHYKIIGLPVWQHFESLDPQMMEKFNTLIFSPDHINFNSPPVIKFRDKFRMLFATEPADGAYLAYDSFLLLGNIISNDEENSDEINFSGLRAKYVFRKNNAETARENEHIYFLKLEDFRYVRIGEK